MMTLKKSFAFVMCVCLIAMLSIQLHAYGGESAPKNPISFEKQIIDILLECEEAERLAVIDKALVGGASIETLSEYLTDEELAYVSDYNLELYGVVSPRKLIQLNVPSIMQEDKSWCGSATAQIVLTYLNGTSPSQSDIVKSITNSPSIDAVTAYINNRITTASLKYTYKSINVSNDFESEFRSRLSSALQSGKPMILQIACDNADSYWRYKTDGHYCLCDGWDLTYGICDPYYYEDYVSIRPGETEGRFSVGWNDINKAIKYWAEQHSNVGYTSY